jgi:two-component system nitrogen regulation response regulator NtrX
VNLKKENFQLENKLFHSFDLIGTSSQILKIKKLITKLSSTDSRILIFGPTGSGKELVARKIHKNSSRSREPFVVLNGALLQPNNYELELFGLENYDGTTTYGSLEKAKNGTLLIDEVSEIPLETQVKILGVLINQKFKRINGKKDVFVNTRIISSTSKDLKNEIAIGNFREDLYHRLNVVPIEIPKLNSRTEDIPLLIKYFQKKIAEINGMPEIDINIEDDLLYTYNWPGNIRELRNLVERISIVSQNENQSNVKKLLHEILNKNSSENLENTNFSTLYPLKQARENFEKNYLLNQLKKNKGNISKTAEFIGMERSALHRKLKSLGIKGIN